LAVAAQAQAIAGISPDRLRLGIGPGGAGNERIYGIAYHHPLGHVREYHYILKALFTQGEVNFDGKYYRAHARLGPANQPPPTFDIPVLTSALQHGSFVLGGEIADGVLTWVCPFTYIRDAGLPSLRAGAQKAGRPAPALIAHVPVAIHDKVEEVRAAVRAQFGFYPRLPYYAAMFNAAGFPNAAETGWTDAMIDATVVSGNETTVAQRLSEYIAACSGDIMALAVAAGPDREGSLGRTLAGLAALR
jgi:alkanesulfonate monooxygenase SsuD/methylene tetrahydromethanopterin reductase-like flavin-dependent oxidoreductase (luciferase family)